MNDEINNQEAINTTEQAPNKSFLKEIAKANLPEEKLKNLNLSEES